MAHQLWLIKKDERINITPLVGEISWKSSIDQLGDELSFNIAFNDTRFFPANPCGIGDMIMLENKGEVFRGIVVSEQRSGRQPLQYTAMDFSFYLNKSQEVYQFNSISATSAILQILRDFSIPIGNVVSIAATINKIYKDKALSDIIRDILATVEAETGDKYVMEMRAGKLYVEPQKILRVEGLFSLAANLEEHSLQTSIGGPSRSLSITEMFNSVKLVNNNDVIHTAKDEALIEKYGLLQQVIEVEDTNRGKAIAIGSNSLKESGRITEKSSLAIMGHDEVRAGRLIEIEEETTGMKGLYIIEGCSHVVKNRIHTMTLDLGVFE